MQFILPNNSIQAIVGLLSYYIFIFLFATKTGGADARGLGRYGTRPTQTPYNQQTD
ncbi:hypothetical protein H6F77_12500 [Microcoleus sp. FACHB-831]|nr:hypothetical protein [Microcoleus sp. FACHB-831]